MSKREMKQLAAQLEEMTGVEVSIDATRTEAGFRVLGRFAEPIEVLTELSNVTDGVLRIET